MLIEPASNVFVPATVVMRTISNVPESETEPAPTCINALSELPSIPKEDQALLPDVEIIAFPFNIDVACIDLVRPNPFVISVALTPVDHVSAEPR